MEKLIKLVKEVFPDADVNNVSALKIDHCPGWDSVGHFSFLMTIEEQFDVRFDLEEIAELRSIEEIAHSLKAKGKL